MTEKELLEAIEAKQTELKESVEAKADTKAVEGLTEDLNGLKSTLKEIKDAQVAQGVKMTELKAVKSTEPKSYDVAFKEAWEANADAVKAVAEGKKAGSGEIEIKADVTTASVQGSTASYRIPGIGKQPVRRVFLDGLFPSGTVGEDSGGTITYWDQDTLNRNADNVAECAPIPESEINWIEQSCKIEKIGDSIPVCIEALEDYSFIQSEVDNFLMENVMLKNDQQILFGTGTSPQYKGIDGTAQTWAAGDFAAMIASPSIVDVILTGKTQIENSGQNNTYMPNYVLMNPTDFRKMKLEKDADGNYLLPNYLSQDATVIENMQVLESPLVASDTLYIMDSTRGTVYNHRNLTLDVANQHADDFLTDRIRLKATLRKSFVIRNVYANAFLKVNSIDAAITALTKP